jgi:uncharacterized damage-inducible protein DinB
MTLQEIKMLHAYTAWANNRIFDALAEVPPELYQKDLKSSHGSIHGTLLHMVGAERRWLARWNGIPDQNLPAMPGVSTLQDLRKIWESNGYELAKFLATMTDKKLQDPFTMTTVSGETFTHSFAQGFQHLMDHSTFHRGQVVTMMRQLGVKPPGTGMIGFFREVGKLK